MCCTHVGHAGDSIWTASSGAFPTSLNPPWQAAMPGGNSVLENGALRITHLNGQATFYQGDGTENQLDFPTNLVIEARMRLVSGTAIIYFVTQPGDAENWLRIGPDEIFVNAGSRTNRGAVAHVDTDNAFHDYRIEVHGVTTGSTVNVFYDGAPTLTGSLFLGDEDEVIQIVWGTLTGGESLWQSFRHNASTAPTVSIFTAAEICWDSKTNLVYEVQWASSLPATNWTSLGTPVSGTGGNLCIFDSTRGQVRRFYRVEIVP
jgi:hypothetical protein